MPASSHPGVPSQTAYGAPWETSSRSAAVLRAAASTSVELLPTGPADLAASVLAAHAWCVATGRTSLRSTTALGSGAVCAAAAILARAAGHGRPVTERSLWEACGHLEPLATQHAHARAIGPGMDWVRDQALETVGPDVTEQTLWLRRVLTTAGADLLAASAGPVAAAGWLYIAAAEDLADH